MEDWEKFERMSFFSVFERSEEVIICGIAVKIASRPKVIAARS